MNRKSMTDRSFVAAILLVGGSLLPGCGILDPGPESDRPISRLPRALSAAEERVIGTSNGFAFDLLRAVNADEAGENMFLSPLSVSMALGMTMNGAADSTLAEMRATLDFGDLSLDEVNGSYRDLIDLLLGLDRATRIELANSVWYDQGFPFEPAFQDTVAKIFGARVEAVDFADPATPGRINDWVSAATRGRIDSILDRVREGDVMFLINAIWFEGAWKTRFPMSGTYEASFGGDESRSVPMMSARGDFAQRVTPDVMAVELPYGNTAFVMTVVMPRVKGIEDFVASLDRSAWDGILSSLWVGEAHVSIPKFTLDYQTSLTGALKALGMPSAFVPGAADFSGLSSIHGRDLHISDVLHRTFVKVDEEGTEAAGATSVGIGVVSAPTPIIIDQPFVFAIRERLTGTILFMGKVVEPADG